MNMLKSPRKASSPSKGKGKEGKKLVDENEKFELELPAEPRPFNADYFGAMVRRGFAKLFETENLCDITLVLKEEKLPAHRTVLCVWSDTFRAMLEHDRWAESSMKELPIEIEPAEIPCFKYMIQYMYTGETDFITGENVMTLISLSNYYGVHSLKETCAELLGQLISEDTLLYFLGICDRYDCQRLEAACGEHLAEHFEEFLENGKLDSLEPSTWGEMLKSDELKVSSEEKLFESVIKYADQFKDDTQKRDAALELLLPQIRFPFLSGTYLVEKVETVESIQHLKVLHTLLHEAYKFKIMPGAINNDRTKPRKGFRFDPQNCHTSITISGDGLVASLLNTSGWFSVRTVQPLLPGSDYVEFKVEGGTNIMLGLATQDCPLTGYCGQYSNGWQFYTNGQVYHNGGCPSNGAAYAVGDTLGVHLDFTQGKITCYKNGSVTASLSGVPTSTTKPLYPAASFSAMGNSVSVKPRAAKP